MSVRPEPRSFTLQQALLLGLLPALATGLAAAISNYFVAQTTQDREDQRLLRLVGFTQTAEARRTQVALVVAPIDLDQTATPPPTVTTAPTPHAGPARPEQAVVDYYQYLADGRSATAWAMLTDQFQQRVNNDDFAAYRAFWETAGEVQVVEALVEERPTATSAVVLASVYWPLEAVTRSYRITLVLDPASQTWRIDVVSAA